jgi:catechol 2,3-dioxygenase-like lactoylglutathione lyase family enzyme
MKIILPCVLLVVIGRTSAQSADRPKISGIDHVDFYTTSAEANEHFYTIVLGVPSVPPLETGQTQRFMVGSQWVGYSPAPDAQATNRMDHLAFRTDDCEALRLYLAAKGIKVPDSVSKLKDGSISLMVKDPEGNAIEFVQPSRAKLVKIYRSEDVGKIATPDPVSRRIIHVGFIVHDRDAEDHFYRDLLGFHIYWHGGMQPPDGLGCDAGTRRH